MDDDDGAPPRLRSPRKQQRSSPQHRRESHAHCAAITDLPALSSPENPVAEAEIRYDPDKAPETLDEATLEGGRRGVQLFFSIAGFIMSIISDRAMNCEPQRREQRASEILELISNLGPAVIKGGASAWRRGRTPVPTRRPVVWRRHRRASSPGMMEVGGLVSDFDARAGSPEYLRKLQELQDRVPAFPTDEALRAWKLLLV